MIFMNLGDWYYTDLPKLYFQSVQNGGGTFHKISGTYISGTYSIYLKFNDFYTFGGLPLLYLSKSFC